MEPRGYILGVSPMRAMPYPIQAVTSTPTLVYARAPIPVSREHTVIQSDGSEEEDKDIVGSPGASRSVERKSGMSKRMRRVIANSNERKRMQNINAGFETLRYLMPHLQGEKLSKASVLQHAADYIFRLKQEQEKLLSQNASLRSLASKYERYGQKDILTENNKVNKATSPIRIFEDTDIDDEKAAVRELETIYAAHEEHDAIKKRLEKEKQYNRSLEDKNKRMRLQDLHKESISKNNLDIIVRAIKQVEGDSCFSSRPATPMEQRTPASFASNTTLYVQQV